MKLGRSKPLVRRSPLRSRPRRRKPSMAEQEARMQWKTPKSGPCGCGCDRWTHHLERHHVISQERIKQEGRWDLLWDLRNGLLLHPECHAAHTSAFRRIRIQYVPVEAFAFAVDLLGEQRAAEEFRRYYDTRVAR